MNKLLEYYIENINLRRKLGQLSEAMFESAEYNKCRFNISGYAPLKIHLLNILDTAGEITPLTIILTCLSKNIVALSIIFSFKWDPLKQCTLSK